jgi:ParB-like chromosome segregation protein Spo0J
MENQIQKVPIEKLVAHPDNPNRMSKKIFAKLVRNIERTGRYEPIVVRPKGESFEIINGHHRVKALQQLGKKIADVVIWDVDDKQTDILLATLNRLGGSDVLDKKLALLNRLSSRMEIRRLAKLLPQSATQINRLTKMRRPTMSANISRKSLANPLVFFLDNEQQRIVKEALSLAQQGGGEKTKAQKNAAALTRIAQCFLERADNHLCHSERSEESKC